MMRNPVPDRPGKSTLPLNVPSELKPTLIVSLAPPAVFISNPAVPLAVMTALISMFLSAVSVSVLALHETVSFTKISPLPDVPPLLLKMVTLLLLRLADNWLNIPSACCNGIIIGVYKPHACFAVWRIGCNLCVLVYLYLCGRCLYKTSVSAVKRR